MPRRDQEASQGERAAFREKQLTLPGLLGFVWVSTRRSLLP